MSNFRADVVNLHFRICGPRIRGSRFLGWAYKTNFWITNLLKNILSTAEFTAKINPF